MVVCPKLNAYMIIGGLLSFLSSTPAMKMVGKTQGNGIVVHLDEVEEARKVLDIVELTNIEFQKNGVTVEVRFR